MVSVLVWIVAYCRFKSRSGQDKDCKIGISCFSIKHAASRRKSKYLLVPNQENVFEWSDMSTNRLLFHCTDLSNLVGLEQSDIIIISLTVACSGHHLLNTCSFGVKQQSLTHPIIKVLISKTHIRYPLSKL